jgi:hypothetical protein
MTLRTPWPTCTTCQAVPLAFFHNGAISKPHRLWLTFSAFADSALRGCHTCTLLYEAVREPFKHRLDAEPVHLERATTNSDGTQAIALTVDLASLPDRGTWDESLWKRNDGQRPGLQFVPIADIKYVRSARDVPQSARHFKGKNVTPRLEFSVLIVRARPYQLVYGRRRSM